jgi:Fe-S cluster biogenesis protein NfuA
MSEATQATRSGHQLDEVKAVFDREIVPLLESHLGGGRVVDIDANGVVEVEFTGACTSCFYRRNTITGAIYPRLQKVEGVSGVISRGVPVTIQQQHRLVERFDEYSARSSR